MKKVYGLLAAMMMVAGVSSADSIDWGNTITFESVVDRFGATVPDGSSFLITLWEDGANNIVEDYNSVGGDDFQVGTLTTVFFSGLFSTSFDPVAEGTADGETIYTQVFDAATIGAASWFVVLDPSGTVVQDSSNPNPPWGYDPTGNTAGEWQPIPEPTTLALLGIGLAGIASRRMRRK